jgi:hypothetical protein
VIAPITTVIAILLQERRSDVELGGCGTLNDVVVEAEESWFHIFHIPYVAHRVVELEYDVWPFGHCDDPVTTGCDHGK